MSMLRSNQKCKEKNQIKKYIERERDRVSWTATVTVTVNGNGKRLKQQHSVVDIHVAFTGFYIIC